jgi:hypothetical protein
MVRRPYASAAESDTEHLHRIAIFSGRVYARGPFRDPEVRDARRSPPDSPRSHAPGPGERGTQRRPARRRDHRHQPHRPAARLPRCRAPGRSGRLRRRGARARARVPGVHPQDAGRRVPGRPLVRRRRQVERQGGHRGRQRAPGPDHRRSPLLPGPGLGPLRPRLHVAEPRRHRDARRPRPALVGLHGGRCRHAPQHPPHRLLRRRSDLRRPRHDIRARRAPLAGALVEAIVSGNVWPIEMEARGQSRPREEEYVEAPRRSHDDEGEGGSRDDDRPRRGPRGEGRGRDDDRRGPRREGGGGRDRGPRG